MSKDKEEQVQPGDLNPEIAEELTDEELKSVAGGVTSPCFTDTARRRSKGASSFVMCDEE